MNSIVASPAVTVPDKSTVLCGPWKKIRDNWPTGQAAISTPTGIRQFVVSLEMFHLGWRIHCRLTCQSGNRWRHTIYVTPRWLSSYPPAKYAYTVVVTPPDNWVTGITQTLIFVRSNLPCKQSASYRCGRSEPFTISHGRWLASGYGRKRVASSASVTKTTRQAYRVFSPPVFAVWQRDGHTLFCQDDGSLWMGRNDDGQLVWGIR